jgi:hypothetical protein
MAQSMGLFPPGKGGGEGVAYGHKGKGVLIHTLTEGNGMPLANCTTPANGNEREQVIPLLDSIKVKTNKPGRPRKRVKVLAADKGYDSKINVLLYVNAVSDHNYPNVFGRARRIGADQSKSLFHVFNKSVVSPGSKENIAGLLFDGKELLPASTVFFLLPQFTSGLAEFY